MDTYREAYAKFVRGYLTRALEAGDWRVARAARIAGLSRDAFYDLIDRYAPEMRRRLAPCPFPHVGLAACREYWKVHRPPLGGNAAWKALDGPAPISIRGAADNVRSSIACR